jgi:predicted lipoprotein with Yx(FWY)xxD motif
VDGRLIQMSRRSAALMAGAALLVAACSLDGGGSPAPASAGSSAAASTAPSAQASSEPSVAASSAPSEAAGGAGITVATDPTLGAILVGEGGKTLYVFTRDTGGASVCNGECATNWPPLLAEGGAAPTAGEGVTGTLGTITRDDGGTQVTYDGKPLYYFIGDTAAGQANGQGLQDVWFVATPTGSTSSSTSGEASKNPNGGRYGTDY